MSLLNGLALNLELGRWSWELVWTNVCHFRLSPRFETESALRKNEVFTVDGTLIILFYYEGSKLRVLLFLCLKRDFGSSSGIFDFS